MPNVVQIRRAQAHTPPSTNQEIQTVLGHDVKEFFVYAITDDNEHRINTNITDRDRLFGLLMRAAFKLTGE